MNLDNFFKAKNIAIIGVSKNPNKVGHVIFRNLLDSHYPGNLFLVNPNADYILGYRCYKSAKDIPEKIDLAIISVPAKLILKTIEDCGKKGIKDVVMITAGFSEIGNYELENRLLKLLTRYKIKVIGPNCLGTFDAHSKLDSLFLPRYRMKRPKPGKISFICQSGAVGSSILDLVATRGYGFAKFISYGNVINVDEADIIEYLGNDKDTSVICLYVEGIKHGQKFFDIVNKYSKKKPIIALKGGRTEAGSKATLSHTGSLAGSAEVYSGVFKQCGIIEANTLEQMFDYARVLDKCIPPKGDRVQIITNGGGYGILSTDAIIKNDLKLADISQKNKELIKKDVPPIVIVSNPMDLVGDATTARYKLAIQTCLDDDNVDILLIILLYQTPLITTDIVDIVTEFNDLSKKPMIVVSVGGEFTEILKSSLEDNGLPCFTFPEDAVDAIKKLVEYYNKKVCIKRMCIAPSGVPDNRKV